MARYDAIVVGAGLAGLGAARELRRRGYSTLVLERESTAGGRARTEPWGDARVELGAWYIAPGYRRVMKLITELGLNEDVEAAAPGFPFAIRGDDGWKYANFFRARSLPQSLQRADIPPLLAAPRKLAVPALRSLRHIPKIEVGDVTHAVAFDAANPADLLGGPFGETFDAFGRMYIGYELRDVGAPFLVSLALGVGRGMTGLGANFQPSYLKHGTGSLTQAIVAKLDVRLGVTVNSTTPTADGVILSATDRTGSVHEFVSDAVILATPADITSSVWRSALPSQRVFLNSVRYTQIALLYLRLRQPFVHFGPNGERVGEIVPDSQRGDRYPGRALNMDWAAPSGGIFVTGESVPDHRVGLPARGKDLADRLEKQLYQLHPGLHNDVTGRRLVVVERYVPVFEQGYVTRLVDFRKSLAPSAIDVAGDYLYSPILEGAYASGLAAAERTEKYLRQLQRARPS
jgi:oxygen-dependent protoporphyrinogen oxidase